MKSSFLNKVDKIAADLYVITETESVHCYLILGTEKALLFDVGYGYEDIMPLIREITALPVMLAVSHGDPDHSLGAVWFEEIWIHELDYGKFLKNDAAEIRSKALDYRLNKMPEAAEHIDRERFLAKKVSKVLRPRFLRDGDNISLGNRELTVIHTPGHSYGHIMLLDEKRKLLFSGDQITRHNIWYFGTADEQASFETALNSLRRIWNMQDKIKAIYPAHNIFPIDMNYVKDQIECLEHELAENYLKDEEFRSFGGDGYQHFYKTVNLIYSDERLEQHLGKKIQRGKS